ncbi:MAG: S41 family peptidase [Acidimicrobiia bacterium]
MRRLLFLLLLTAAACSTQTGTISTPSTAPPTVPASTTTTTTPLSIEIQDCETPPVTFSTLCETIELLDEWYVDRPVDYSGLATIATEAAAEYETEDSEDPPRTFFCAIPDGAFVTLCDLMRQRVQNEHLPVADALEVAVTAMIDLGLDPFTWYVPPELAGGFRSDGVVGGVGILLDATDAAGSKCTRVAAVCPLRIVFVLEDNPGEEAGLLAGDVISTIDGESVNDRGLVDVATLIGGDQTGTVVLGIVRSGTPLEITVERQELEFPETTVDVPLDGVGYLRIPDFSFQVPFLVDASIGALLAAGPGTIVVDLRDNPGGLVEAVVSVASQFIAEGTVLNYEFPGGSSSYEVSGGATATASRLIVLVNEGTASAAEILAGALRDMRGATIIGQPTYGKNALQIPFELRNGGEFHVAIARWTTPSGQSVGDNGLIPDRIVDFPAGADTEQLTRFAIENS